MEKPDEYEKKMVQDVYEEIAKDFDRTRFSKWKTVVEFINSQKEGSMGLDAGCGNGKYLNIRKDIKLIGFDMSKELIKISNNISKLIIRSNCLFINYRNNLFDFTICIAVIHHFSSWERRRNSIKELLRVTNKNGEILIYVWAFEQNKTISTDNGINEEGMKPYRISVNDDTQRTSSEINTSTDNGINEETRTGTRTDPSISIDKGTKTDPSISIDKGTKTDPSINIDQGTRTDPSSNIDKGTKTDNYSKRIFTDQDALVPWKLNNDKVLNRYYHLFKKGEIYELVSGLGEIKKIGYEKGNWFVIIKKID